MCICTFSIVTDYTNTTFRKHSAFFFRWNTIVRTNNNLVGLLLPQILIYWINLVLKFFHVLQFSFLIREDSILFYYNLRLNAVCTVCVFRGLGCGVSHIRICRFWFLLHCQLLLRFYFHLKTKAVCFRNVVFVYLWRWKSVKPNVASLNN
jgi:hypothetical protein